MRFHCRAVCPCNIITREFDGSRPTDAVAGVAWCRPEQQELLLQISADRESLLYRKHPGCANPRCSDFDTAHHSETFSSLPDKFVF
jgi:hypothetical protein